MKSIILLSILLTLSSNLHSSEPKGQESCYKEFFEFENKHVNLKVCKKENFQIAYRTDKGEWTMIEVNLRNVCKYSAIYLCKSAAVIRKAF